MSLWVPLSFQLPQSCISPPHFLFSGRIWKVGIISTWMFEQLILPPLQRFGTFSRCGDSQRWMLLLHWQLDLCFYTFVKLHFCWHLFIWIRFSNIFAQTSKTSVYISFSVLDYDVRSFRILHLAMLSSWFDPTDSILLIKNQHLLSRLLYICFAPLFLFSLPFLSF